MESQREIATNDGAWQTWQSWYPLTHPYLPASNVQQSRLLSRRFSCGLTLKEQLMRFVIRGLHRVFTCTHDTEQAADIPKGGKAFGMNTLRWGAKTMKGKNDAEETLCDTLLIFRHVPRPTQILASCVVWNAFQAPLSLVSPPLPRLARPLFTNYVRTPL